MLIGCPIAELYSPGTLHKLRRFLLLDSAADDFPLLGSGTSSSWFLGAATASLLSVVTSVIEEMLLDWREGLETSRTDAGVDFVFEPVGIRFDHAEVAFDEVVGRPCDGLHGCMPVYISMMLHLSRVFLTEEYELPYVLSSSRNLEAFRGVRSTPPAR